MNIFLTGASGFLGTALLRDLLLKGHSVTALVRPRHGTTVRHYLGCRLSEYDPELPLNKYLDKTLLVDPSLRISEIVFAAGFGSIPRFNSVFKRYVGMPATEYRASLRPS